jgi:peptidyl-prolyl cis-trans isomerase SurA
MRFLKAFAIFQLISSPVFGQALDRIIAVVDKQIVLQSELDAQVQLFALQNRLDLSNKAFKDSLEIQLLDKMVEDKVLLVEADRDTSITVTNKDIEAALTAQIDKIKSQFASEDAFLAELRAEGLTLKELRSRYHDEVRNQLLKEKYIQQKLEKAQVSSGDVRQFYDVYRDSLPEKPASVHLAHVLFGTQPGKPTRDSLYQYAEQVRAKALAGEDFALLARTYSQDPGASAGGDLGWFSRGEMVPEFETAAFALQPGQVSEVVETKFGFHIIKCTGRKGDKIKASHILVQLKPSPEDLAAKLSLADSLYFLLQGGADFSAIARQYSDDETSRDSGGDLGWYAANDLLPEFKEALTQIDVGQVSRPVKSDFGFHIVKLLETRPAGPLTLKDDYGTLEEMARRQKAQKQIEDLIDRISSGMYIDKRL